MTNLSEPVKIYVDVDARFTKDGILRPTCIIWEDGHKYPIQRIRKCQRAASLKAGGTGIRYTIVISGKDRYLYYEENNKWFVESKTA